MNNSKTLSSLFFFFLSISAIAQSRFSKRELSINGFRNPSIGLEYRQQRVSGHGGLYLTNFKSNETTRFVKIGATYWFLPVGKRENPSSFYLQVSYLRGLNRAYKNQNAFSPDFGFRTMIWKGSNFRVGIVGIFANGHKPSILWTLGISYSFFSKKQ